MGKKVLVRLDGCFGVYETLAEASKALDMAPESISRAISESGRAKGVPLRWVDRVYAVREREGDWKIAIMNSRNTAFLPVSQIGEKIEAKKIFEKKDITAAWYWHGI